jgi:hypothetical protein
METRTERRDVQVAQALGAAAEGSYEQEAAAVDEDEEMEREDEQGWRSQQPICHLDLDVPCAGMGRTAGTGTG